MPYSSCLVVKNQKYNPYLSIVVVDMVMEEISERELDLILMVLKTVRAVVVVMEVVGMNPFCNS